VRELPRQLTVEELTELFEVRTPLVDRLATLDDPLERAGDAIAALTDSEKEQALNAHPRIGAAKLSARSAAEQGDEDDPQLLAELERLNRVYEDKFGFRFVIFVNRRPRSQILPELRDRLERSREEELDEGLRELVAIARDRWTRTT
jgi:2-oxo-4-hydroxy-4-carboxy--5-ureidoimidazoline (OHCU) decarboxylase